jgi:hypothetical protein
LQKKLQKSHIDQWATDALDVVAVKNSIPYLHGLWNGEEFTAPDNQYLKSIGLVADIVEETLAE